LALVNEPDTEEAAGTAEFEPRASPSQLACTSPILKWSRAEAAYLTPPAAIRYSPQNAKGRLRRAVFDLGRLNRTEPQAGPTPGGSPAVQQGRRISALRLRLMIGAAGLAGVAAIFGPVVAASTGFFQNGTFNCSSCEQSNLISQGFYTIGSANATVIPGWTVTRNSVDWIDGYWSPPPGGGYSLDMNGTLSAEPSGDTSAAGAIAQTFETVPNVSYAVSFELSANPSCGTGAAVGSPYSLTAQTGSTDGRSFSAKVVSPMSWSPELYTFTASGTSTTLTFAANPDNKTNCGPVLADVAVTSGSTASCTNTDAVSCSTNLTSPSTGTDATVTGSGSGGFLLQTAFGSGQTLACDSQVSTGTADPLVVIAYPQGSSSGPISGTVTLTFTKDLVHEIPGNKGTPHMPVCVGATQKFPMVGQNYAPPTATYPYQGLLYACSNPTYKADISSSSTPSYPLQICVASYARVHGAEQVVIDASSLGDPMFW